MSLLCARGREAGARRRLGETVEAEEGHKASVHRQALSMPLSQCAGGVRGLGDNGEAGGEWFGILLRSDIDDEAGG